MCEKSCWLDDTGEGMYMYMYTYIYVLYLLPDVSNRSQRNRTMLFKACAGSRQTSKARWKVSTMPTDTARTTFIRSSSTSPLG